MITNLLMAFSGYFIAFGLVALTTLVALALMGTPGRLVMTRMSQRVVLWVGILMLCLGVFFSGADWKDQKYKALQATATQNEKVAKAKIDELNLMLAKKKQEYDKEVQVITKTQVVTKYITKKSDDACVVPVGFVRIHDSGVAATPIAPSNEDLGANSGLKLSEVGEVVRGNYLEYNVLANSHRLLQDWVKESKRIHDAAQKDTHK